jgi:recombinational DNA repair ATPase RecF
LPHYGDGTNDYLLAKMKAEIRTNREETLAEMETNQERMKAKIDANLQEITVEMRAWWKKMEMMKAYPERLETRIETNQEPMEAEFKTGLAEVEAMDLEANSEEKEAIAEQQEVPKEEAAV